MRNLKLLSKSFILFIIVLKGYSQNNPQSTKLFGDTKFTIVGNVQADYITNSDLNEFGNVAFKPIFLWSLSDKLFMESELEISTDAGSVELVLEYANMVYFVNNNLALHFGRFLPKFGSYRGKYMEGFLNKFTTDPVGFGDGGIGPMTETGFGAQGGANIGKTRINYDFYVSNGPQLLPGTVDSPDEAGQFEYEAYSENNKNKAIGGRFGFLPLSDASLELGLSFQHANKTGDRNTNLEPVKVDMYSIDLNYIRKVEFLNSIVRAIGEWKSQKTGDALYQNYEIQDTYYSFKNNSTAYYGQLSIRPTGSDSAFINKLEFSGRYSEFKTPVEALWGGGLKKQTAFSINYWLGWNRVFKLQYQNQTGMNNSVIAQVVYGF